MTTFTSAPRVARRIPLIVAFAAVIGASPLQAVPVPAGEKINPDGSIEPFRIADVLPADYRLVGVVGARPEARLDIVYPNATYLKLHFSLVDLPPGATVVMVNGDGSDIYRFTREKAIAQGIEYGYTAMSLMGDTAHITIEGGMPGDRFALHVDRIDVGFASAFKPDAVIGSDQRKRAVCFATEEPDVYRHSKAVARIVGPAGVGSAWRVGPENRMLTNHHVMANGSRAADYELWFGYEHHKCSGSDLTTAWVKASVGTLLTGDKKLDFQLFTVEHADFTSGKLDEFGYLGLDASPLSVGTAIYIPQHGGGAARDIATTVDDGTPCSIIKKDKTMGRYHCDIIGGSSGSPVIDRSSHRVRVLHNSAAAPHNQGHAIEHIWPRISAYFEGMRVPGGS